MSTDYFLVCFDCKEIMEGIIASSAGSYGFKVWDEALEDIRKFLGHREDIGLHEWHDVRLVNEHYDLPWENEGYYEKEDK